MTARFSMSTVDADPVAEAHTEFVERKGIGHPDSLCDGVAEAVSRRLSQYYRDTFGRVLHHNTDKVHLGAGRAEPAFHGGSIVEPIYVLVGGRATTTVDGEQLPVDELAREAAGEYLLATVPLLEPDDVVVDTRIGRTSDDLASLFGRGGEPLANDTSFGVSHAPGTVTERFVKTLEPRLHQELDAVGKDVKLMALRRGDHVYLTIAAAVIDRYVDDMAEYRAVIDRVQSLAERHAAESTHLSVSVDVNAADDFAEGSVYLTTTGLSAEGGDDGAVGRGNRVNGLITPHRPMSLEAAAGKNPVTHVGKLYNLLALRIARRLEVDLDASYGCVQILSRIGDPVSEPVAVDVSTTLEDGEAVRSVVDDQFGAVDTLTEDIIEGRVSVF